MSKEKDNHGSLLLRHWSWYQGLYVDQMHSIYKVFLDSKEVPYQDGMGNASTIEGNTLVAMQLTPIKLWLA